jgi:hypothetical protein
MRGSGQAVRHASVPITGCPRAAASPAALPPPGSAAAGKATGARRDPGPTHPTRPGPRTPDGLPDSRFAAALVDKRRLRCGVCQRMPESTAVLLAGVLCGGRPMQVIVTSSRRRR